MSEKRTAVILKPGKEQSLLRMHPWVFSGAIHTIPGNVREGEIVNVLSSRNEYLATGHYQVGSIAVRVLSFSPIENTRSFWKDKIQAAFLLRETLGLTSGDETNVFRLVNAEGDGLPGLIIDFYNGVAVMQMHTVGMFLNREAIAEALKAVLGDKLTAIYDKSVSTLPFKAKIDPKDGFMFGPGAENIVSENGLKLRIDWAEGQKTGFFVDQRENRKLLETYSKGRKVLNTFCYTGGFSVYALRGGAELVHSVDSSAKAIDLARENMSLNFRETDKHEAFVADVANFLRNNEQKYNLIILDPPAFAKHNNVLDNALQGYKRLNARAIEIIEPGGIIFTFSCSQVVSRENFRKSVFTAAANTGRQVKILHQLSQPPDHPVSIYHPEGEYLKGLVIQVF
jgi:23S rRNA (cytosine1962-C5)-methyltransferase